MTDAPADFMSTAPNGAIDRAQGQSTASPHGGTHPPRGPEGLLQKLRTELRLLHYSRRTEEAYVAWVRRFVVYHKRRHPAELGPSDIRAFLSALANRGQVSASTQNQAMAAIAFLYRDVLRMPIESVGDVVRAKRPARLPVVLSRDEVDAVLAKMHGTSRLVASLLYGGGLRLLEGLALRVKDVDLERRQLIVRGGKGGKDRTTVLPSVLYAPLAEYLRRMRVRHQGEGAWKKVAVTLPESIGRKYPSAGYEWPWQYLFRRAAPAPRCGDAHLGASPSARDGSAARGAGGRTCGGNLKAGDVSHVPPLVRDASIGRRLRHPDGAGASWPYGREHDDDLHARTGSRCVGGPEPDGPSVGRPPALGQVQLGSYAALTADRDFSQHNTSSPKAASVVIWYHLGGCDAAAGARLLRRSQYEDAYEVCLMRVRRHCASSNVRMMSQRTWCLMLVIGSGCAQPPDASHAVTKLAGCYEFAFGAAARWRPVFLLPPIDGGPRAPRVRLVLRATADTSAPEQPAYALDGGRAPVSGYSYWRPDGTSGIAAAWFDVDLGARMKLDQNGEGRFIGVERGFGSIEGGSSRRRVSAQKVDCSGFAPGYKPGADEGAVW